VWCLSRLTIRTAPVWVALCYTIGGMLLNKGLSLLPWLSMLRFIHVHLPLIKLDGTVGVWRHVLDFAANDMAASAASDSAVEVSSRCSRRREVDVLLEQPAAKPVAQGVEARRAYLSRPVPMRHTGGRFVALGRVRHWYNADLLLQPLK
jgi:hypothetical protein